jgi:hypothetical protein
VLAWKAVNVFPDVVSFDSLFYFFVILFSIKSYQLFSPFKGHRGKLVKLLPESPFVTYGNTDFPEQ